MAATSPRHEIVLDEDVREGLLKLTEYDSEKASKLTNETLRELIDYRRRFLAAIDAGARDIEEGRLYSSDEVRAELDRRRSRGK
jgi:predicted transcriptional regulator